MASMRPRIVLAACLAALLSCLTAGPALAQAKRLEVRRATCDGVDVVGQGLPANQQLFLLVRNLATGGTVGGQPTPVRSGPDGEVRARLDQNLRGIRTVQVSIWTGQGDTLTMTAKDTASTGCGSSSDLAYTGPPAVAVELLVALLLLAAGTAALWWTRTGRAA